MFDLKDASGPQFFPQSCPLAESYEIVLSANWHVRYLFTLSRNLLSKHPKLSSCSGLDSVEVNTENWHEVLSFIQKNYYRKFHDKYSAGDVKKFLDSADDYLALGITGKIYSKMGNTISCFLSNRFANFPLLNQPTIHVGYMGYDRHQLTLDEARFLKSDWLKTAESIIQEGDQLDATVAAFNKPSLAWVKKVGFEQRGVRLEPKIT